MRWKGRPRALEAGELAERLAGRRLIFTITTGRSGTLLLARAIALHRGVAALHEPRPTFSSALRSVLAEPGVAREFWLAHKLPRILERKESVYAETSHLVCKGFLESLVDLGVRPELVVLSRPARAVARSLLALGTIPGRTYGGVKYYLSPSESPCLPLERARWERFSDYQLCFWYCQEIEARARAYEARWAPLGMRFTRIDFEALIRPAGITELAAKLGLPALGRLGRMRALALASLPSNERTARKRPVEHEPGALEREEAEVLRVIETLPRKERVPS
jgi:hypothetical protein